MTLLLFCLAALGSSAVINQVDPETPELVQSGQIESIESDDLSTAESANPQYLGNGFHKPSIFQMLLQNVNIYLYI